MTGVRDLAPQIHVTPKLVDFRVAEFVLHCAKDCVESNESRCPIVERFARWAAEKGRPKARIRSASAKGAWLGYAHE
jgi:hypothetical protein